MADVKPDITAVSLKVKAGDGSEVIFKVRIQRGVYSSRHHSLCVHATSPACISPSPQIKSNTKMQKVGPYLCDDAATLVRRSRW